MPSSDWSKLDFLAAFNLNWPQSKAKVRQKQMCTICTMYIFPGFFGGMLAFFTNSSLTEFRSGFLSYLFFFGTALGDSEWDFFARAACSFWCSSRFYSYQTVIIFLMILSVILLSILMTIHFFQIVVGLLIYNNSYSWLLRLNLTYDTLDLTRK